MSDGIRHQQKRITEVLISCEFRFDVHGDIKLRLKVTFKLTCNFITLANIFLYKFNSRYDEELAQSDLLSAEARSRIGTGGPAARPGARDTKKSGLATWK